MTRPYYGHDHVSDSHILLLWTIMNFNLLSWLSVLVLAWVVSASKEAPTELKIDVTHKPEDCPVTAQKGDAIKVHYVC